MNRLQGKFQRFKTGPSQLELEQTDGVARRHSVIGRGESERKAQTANQLVPTSPVAKKAQRRPANQDREYRECH